MKKNFISYFLLLKLISFSLNYEIYEKNVENCQKYFCEDEGNCQTEEIKKCKQCNDKYFPFLKGLLCLPCDDPTYGNVGCGGNCDGSKFENIGFAYCEKDGCKEGFYYMEGKCVNCSLTSPGCKRCHNKEIVNSDNQFNYEFVCDECLNNEYKLTEFGICKKCTIARCNRCAYTNNYSNEE